MLESENNFINTSHFSITNSKLQSPIDNKTNLLTNIDENSKIIKNHPLLNGHRIINEWKWDSLSKSPCISLTSNNKIAYFFDNPYTISRGTVGIRGDTPFKQGIYYFEVLVNEPLYGTAVMIGLGTSDICLHYENFDYVNLIGNDVNSWGLCHKGTLHHKNQSQKYCDAFFEKDTLIGCLYNANNKTIHYFVNEKYLGVAFKNVNPNNEDLYPILSSTATDVELELVSSFKIIYSLEDMCCQIISNSCKNYDRLPIAQRLIKNLKIFSTFS